MTLKSLNNWSGLIAVAWLLGIRWFFSLDPRVISYRIPDSLLLLAVMVIWLGVGLLFAVSGLRRGNDFSRICSVFALFVFIDFALGILNPVRARAY
jgi:hypothetical protein